MQKTVYRPSDYHKGLPDDGGEPTPAQIVTAASVLLRAMAMWAKDEEHDWLREALENKRSRTYSFVSSLVNLVDDDGKI